MKKILEEIKKDEGILIELKKNELLKSEIIIKIRNIQEKDLKEKEIKYFFPSTTSGFC